MLVRDVTELRRRERELLTKDATIREIHHRVKNNLQTVAALLRLQARRLDVPEGRSALEEAVRRVGSIALVHELLSTTPDEAVPFDEVADRVLAMVAELSAAGPGRCSAVGAGPQRVVRGGRAPRSRPRWPWCCPSWCRTPSSTGWTAAPGLLEVRRRARGRRAAGRGARRRGRPARRVRPRRRPTGSGLQIVRTLVEGELGGSLRLDRARGRRRHGRGASRSRSRPDAGRPDSVTPGPFGAGRRVRRCAGQAIRARARAVRRLSARRSSSDRPPQTPWS